MANGTITTLRLPEALIERAEALIDPLSDDADAALLGRVTRSVVLRLAVLRGLEQLEGKYGVTAPPKKPTASGKAKRRSPE